MSYDATILALVNEFIINTRLLISMLKDDGEYFKQNNVRLLEENNNKKNTVNNKLGDLIGRLQAMPSLSLFDGSIYERLLQYTHSIPAADKSQFETILSKMHDEIMNYNHFSTINRHVVRLNLAYIKDLFFALVNNKTNEKPQATYDRMGALESL